MLGPLKLARNSNVCVPKYPRSGKGSKTLRLVANRRYRSKLFLYYSSPSFLRYLNCLNTLSFPCSNWQDQPNSSLLCKHLLIKLSPCSKLQLSLRPNNRSLSRSFPSSRFRFHLIAPRPSLQASLSTVLKLNALGLSVTLVLCQASSEKTSSTASK